MSGTLLGRGRDGGVLDDLEIIDVHGHLGAFAFGIPDVSPAGVVATMDRLGVGSVICSSMACMSAEVHWGNSQILAAMRAFPGRLLGYISVYPFSAMAVSAEVEQWIDGGFSGFKLHNVNGFPYTDAAYVPALAAADAHRMPVLLHTWGDDRVFDEVRELAGRYDHAAFLLAHAGCVNSEGYMRVAAECRNVYLDLAFSGSSRGLVERLVAGVGAGKVLWGSDVYFLSQAQQIGKVLGAAIPDTVKRRLLSTNAKELLARIH